MCLEVVSVDCSEIPLGSGAFDCLCCFFVGEAPWASLSVVSIALVVLDTGPLICHFRVLFFRVFYPRVLITIFSRCLSFLSQFFNYFSCL